MKKNKGTFWILIAVIVLAVGLLGYRSLFTKPVGSGGSTRVPCINPALPIPPEYHIHPHLRMMVNGNEVAIPANIGLGLTSCELALHTHDPSGTLHIEPNFYQEFTLDDFFDIWGKPFSESQILDSRTDADHVITMTVNGQPSTEFGKMVLKDKQEILIEYKKK